MKIIKLFFKSFSEGDERHEQEVLVDLIQDCVLSSSRSSRSHTDFKNTVSIPLVFCIERLEDKEPAPIQATRGERKRERMSISHGRLAFK